MCLTNLKAMNWILALKDTTSLEIPGAGLSPIIDAYFSNNTSIGAVAQW